MKRNNPGDIVKGAVKRSQYCMDDIFRICGISRGAYYRKARSGEFTIPEIRRLDMAVHFLDEEKKLLCSGR